MSSFLEQRQLDLIGKRLNSWNPAINELFTGDVDTVAFKDEDYIYEISRKEPNIKTFFPLIRTSVS